MLNYWFASSHRDDSNKWSDIGFGKEITITELASDEVNFKHLIWSSDTLINIQTINVEYDEMNRVK